MPEVWLPYAVVLVGAAATYVWRMAGVMMAGRLSPNSPWVEWVGYVAYALLAALVARVIVFPVGMLDETPLWTRLVAAGAAILLFFLLKRSLLVPVLGGGALLAFLAGAK